MQEQISEFVAAMKAAGIGPDSASKIIADDKIHRYKIAGDKAKTTNGAYKLTVQGDGFAVGWFKSWRDGVTHPWHTKIKRSVTPDERAAYKARAEAARQTRDADDAAIKARAASKAVAMLAGMGKATGSERYLNSKGIGPHGARTWRDLVVIPVNKNGATVGLQFISQDGSKRFLTGCDMAGSYFSIAKRDDDLSTIAIVEGFATGASVREAMGWPVIVAFNAGNLKPVAITMRGKYPDARIVICADNDQWTEINGKPVNPGRVGAEQAAVAIGGAQVVWPDIPSDDPGKRTDWNDLHQSEGIEAVRDGLTAAPIVERVEDDTPPTQEPEWRGDDIGPTPDEIDPLDAIRPLGHSRGVYYFFPRTSGQIVELGASSLSRIQNLYRLAPRGFWELHYSGDGKTSDSDICAFASAHLMEECHRKGVFQADNVRGVGAWKDVNGVVVNCGDVVVSRDGKCNPTDYKSKFVYEAGPRVINLDCAPLSNKEAARLRDICKALSWKRSQYADLLCGWIVIAAIGSAVDWRPHIVVTGPKGSGKSTVMDDIIKASLGPMAIKRDGGTTEPGMRKALGASGRPFIMDEAESESAGSRIEMERIFFAARRSSSGSIVDNANATFQLRSCFCFAAINPRIEQGADKDRITSLELVADKSAGSEERFAGLQDLIATVITTDFPARLLARTVENIDALLDNINTFTLAAAKILGNRRDGDQIGPLIAGAYSLTSTKVISKADAERWMQSQNWDWHVAAKDVSDAEKLMQVIMTARVRYDDSGMGRESSIGELVSRAAQTDGVGYDAAVKGLAGYGIRIKDGELLIANSSPPLRRVLQDTPWAVWSRTLGDYPGSHNNGNKPVYFGPGWTSKAISVPLVSVIGSGEIVAADEEDIGF